MKSLGLFFLTILFVVSCKVSENFTGSESVSVLELKSQYHKNVSFSLVNQSDQPVQIESTEHLYIEKFEDGNWVKVPFIPCPCGTPCRQPAVSKLLPQGTIEISWDLISRKCGNENGMLPPVNTIEHKVTGGDYRMTFNINREKDGMRIEPEQLIVSFSIK